MKKRILLLLICTISVLGASATILFTSSCGKQTYTVDESYFTSEDEAKKYYKELDEILCENNGEDEDIEDPGPDAN